MKILSERVIGSLVLPEGHTFTRHYETASWYTDIRVADGTYDVVLKSYEINGHTRTVVTCSLPGVVTGSSFTDRLFHCSSTHVNEDVGKADTWPVTLATKECARIPSGEVITKWRTGSYGLGYSSLRKALDYFQEQWGWLSLSDDLADECYESARATALEFAPEPSCTCGGELCSLDCLPTCAKNGQEVTL